MRSSPEVKFKPQLYLPTGTLVKWVHGRAFSCHSPFLPASPDRLPSSAASLSPSLSHAKGSLARRAHDPLKGARGQAQTPEREFIRAITAAHYFHLISRSEFRKQADRKRAFAVASDGFLLKMWDGRMMIMEWWSVGGEQGMVRRRGRGMVRRRGRGGGGKGKEG